MNKEQILKIYILLEKLDGGFHLCEWWSEWMRDANDLEAGVSIHLLDDYIGFKIRFEDTKGIREYNLTRVKDGKNYQRYRHNPGLGGTGQGVKDHKAAKALFLSVMTMLINEKVKELLDLSSKLHTEAL